MRKYARKKQLFLFMTILFGVLFFSTTAKAGEQTRIEAVGQDSQTYDGFNQVLYNSENYSCHMQIIKRENTWMIPGRDLLSNILGCSYRIDEPKIYIQNPDRTIKITLSVNSSTADINGVTKTMPMPVLHGVGVETNRVDYYIPLDFIMKELGYSYIVKDNSLTITSNYIYTISQNNPEFDSKKYKNALEGVTIGGLSNAKKDYVFGLTSVPAVASDISYLPNAKENSITMKFSHTKNLLGTINQSIADGIISSIKVWEESEATYIKIYYLKKYIYTKKTTEDGGRVTFTKGSFSMKIVLPDKVSFSKIKTTDQYWKKRFLILIPGNYVAFYKKYPPFKNSSSIKKYSVRKTAEGNTRITVTTKKQMGYRLTAREGAFTIKVGSPKSIYKNIVILDAGHGGKDSGARRRGIKEKNLNLSILYTQAKRYFEDISSPVKAYWTRHDDTFISLYSRSRYAQKYSADLFVSLHMNDAPTSRARGVEVYYSKMNKHTMSGLNSRIFAKRMYRTLIQDLHSKRRGVRQAGFWVIKQNTVPSILIELGFVSNTSDRNKLKNKSYQKKAAKSIYRGIVKTFKTYPTK